MLELGEDEGCAGYLGGAAGVCGDVLEGGPALGEQGEPAFPAAAQVAEQRVAGAGSGVEFLVPGWFFDRGEDAYSGSFVAEVGQRRDSEGGGAVEGGQGVPAGGGQVVDRAGLGRADPEREAVGARDGLDVPAVAVRLTGVPGVDRFAFYAGRGSEQRSPAKTLPSRITCGTPSAIARSRACARPGACADRASTASAT